MPERSDLLTSADLSESELVEGDGWWQINTVDGVRGILVPEEADRSVLDLEEVLRQAEEAGYTIVQEPADRSGIPCTYYQLWNSEKTGMYYSFYATEDGSCWFYSDEVDGSIRLAVEAASPPDLPFSTQKTDAPYGASVFPRMPCIHTGVSESGKMPLLYILNIEVVGDLDLIQLAGVRPGDGGGKQDYEADLGSGGQIDDERCREDRGQDHTAVAQDLDCTFGNLHLRAGKGFGILLGQVQECIGEHQLGEQGDRGTHLGDEGDIHAGQQRDQTNEEEGDEDLIGNAALGNSTQERGSIPSSQATRMGLGDQDRVTFRVLAVAPAPQPG